MPAFISILVAALLMLAGSANADGSEAERARELLMPFKQEMKDALVIGMQRGPVAAVDACRIEAPIIAKRHSNADVAIGRSSHRLRNPANKPPAWVQPILDDYVARREPGPPDPVQVDLDGNRVGYVEPIMTGQLCVACHGENLAPPLAKQIAKLYPDDQATGFRPGELRGVFWVEMAAGKTP